MEKEELIKVKVTDFKTLKKLGYNRNKYYVGPWGLMSKLTKLRDILKKHGVKFPFNPHAFKHDTLYNFGGSITWKMKVDFIFLKDMLQTVFSSKIPKKIQKRMLLRALFFYFIVVISTPVYLAKGNWKR